MGGDDDYEFMTTRCLLTYSQWQIHVVAQQAHTF